MASATYFDLFSLDPDAPVDRDALKATYRRLAREAHPDAGGSAERFRELKDAYAVLDDPEQTRWYLAEIVIRAARDRAAAGQAPLDGTAEFVMNQVAGDAPAGPSGAPGVEEVDGEYIWRDEYGYTLDEWYALPFDVCYEHSKHDAVPLPEMESLVRNAPVTERGIAWWVVLAGGVAYGRGAAYLWSHRIAPAMLGMTDGDTYLLTRVWPPPPESWDPAGLWGVVSFFAAIALSGTLAPLRHSYRAPRFFSAALGIVAMSVGLALPWILGSFSRTGILLVAMLATRVTFKLLGRYSNRFGDTHRLRSRGIVRDETVGKSSGDGTGEWLAGNDVRRMRLTTEALEEYNHQKLTKIYANMREAEEREANAGAVAREEARLVREAKAEAAMPWPVRQRRRAQRFVAARAAASAAKAEAKARSSALTPSE
jgi:hypothetical protein